MTRSQITVDLGALRRNVERLRSLAEPAELWAVVKANAYGHGALDCARAALEAGARALCVVTLAEALEVRQAFPRARILLLCQPEAEEEEAARAARLEVTVSRLPLPQGLPVHLKVDTGMGRLGLSPERIADLPADRVVGLMTHLASADEQDDSFARVQLARFAELARAFPGAQLHAANTAATLRLPEARLHAVRCGIGIYGLSPFNDDGRLHGLEPVLAWRSHLALVRTLAPGESTGYGRRFVAERPTRIGLVPVGYADGWRRGLTGTEVLVSGVRRRSVGTVSMDSFAVQLEQEAEGDPVTLIGDGLAAEEHARRLGTIVYELSCGIDSSPRRAQRIVIDA